MITDRDTAAESTSDGGPDAKELMGFALQVARGMSHISHHQVINTGKSMPPFIKFAILFSLIFYLEKQSVALSNTLLISNSQLFNALKFKEYVTVWIWQKRMFDKEIAPGNDEIWATQRIHITHYNYRIRMDELSVSFLSAWRKDNVKCRYPKMSGRDDIMDTLSTLLTLCVGNPLRLLVVSYHKG